MRIFFADESERGGDRPGMGRLMAFGGFHVPDEELAVLEREIEIITEAVLPSGTEIKWSPGPGSPLRDLEEAERRDLYCRLLRSVQKAGGRAVVVVIDTGRTTLEGRDALRWALKLAFERFNTDLAKREEYGILIPDQPSGGPKDTAAFLEDFMNWVQNGTEYSPGDRIQLNAIPSPSRFVRPLQIADVVVAATTAMVGGAYRYAGPVFEEIKPMFIRNSLGYVGGTGLKVFPEQLTNLYYWVLGETVFTKARMGMGWPLPSPGMPYCEGGGGDLIERLGS